MSRDPILLQCLSKKQFNTYEEADEARQQGFYRHVTLAIYKCPICEKYHLTSRKRTIRNSRKQYNYSRMRQLRTNDVDKLL